MLILFLVMPKTWNSIPTRNGLPLFCQDDQCNLQNPTQAKRRLRPLKKQGFSRIGPNSPDLNPLDYIFWDAVEVQYNLKRKHLIMYTN